MADGVKTYEALFNELRDIVIPQISSISLQDRARIVFRNQYTFYNLITCNNNTLSFSYVNINHSFGVETVDMVHLNANGGRYYQRNQSIPSGSLAYTDKTTSVPSLGVEFEVILI